MYEPHQDTAKNDKHAFPEPNTYDYASQLMFDANSFAPVSNPIDLHPAYLDFFQNGGDPYEMMRYQAAMQQSHDYASSCSSNNTPPTSYSHPIHPQSFSVPPAVPAHSMPPQAAAYPMMAFHQDGNAMGISLEQAAMNYPIPYDHHTYMGPPVPTLSTSSSSSSSLSSNNTAYGLNASDNRGAQVYVRKACVSCKQSHVACDVQRPCARCVRLNKADTCVDAERKKRGRPCGSSKKKKEQQLQLQQQQQQQQQQNNMAANYNHLL
ncbi:uncharacterized protein ATC70_000170 [Mucor velutinosus]|uniref:Zn(2)-C6 fungal-type domain-containing protein n=1 Tax=Mucor velutinosus TaxID=708070 RepID=A0AAN7HTV3_9FUNG|nr:hypothetical protein ATC70_000170 [Mucor velutinosus]